MYSHLLSNDILIFIPSWCSAHCFQSHVCVCVQIHQPLGGAQGQAADIEIQAKEILFVRWGNNTRAHEYKCLWMITVTKRIRNRLSLFFTRRFLLERNVFLDPLNSLISLFDPSFAFTPFCLLRSLLSGHAWTLSSLNTPANLWRKSKWTATAISTWPPKKRWSTASLTTWLKPRPATCRSRKCPISKMWNRSFRGLKIFCPFSRGSN